ncbi:hypothetical protein ANAEL_05432 [Anaerolineales bacterium]|nr:hypothetical protein ANAEL_05432 [Anaerolineales bacterium]
MEKNVTRSLPSRGGFVSASLLTVVFSAVFLLILLLLHFLEPEFDPLWRMISEYELGQYGWMMQLAFACWGMSVLFVLVTLWPDLRTLGGRIGRWWLVLVGIALFGAGIFVTNAITDPPTSTAHTLHALCGAFVILTFPIASALVVGSLAKSTEWASVRHHLLWVELLVWLSMFAFFGSIIVSRAINPAAGRVGPDVFLGWPNRFMVVVYHVWLIVIALDSKRLHSGVL